VQQGDAQVVARLFERYAQRLAKLAEQHLSRRVAVRVDGEDVVQSVFRTFFRRSAQGEFQIDSSAQIWKLLATITVRKARASARYHTAEMRDPRAEVPGGDDSAFHRPVSHEPGPVEVVTLFDQIEELLAGLPSMYSDVLSMRLLGWSVSEIGPELDVSRRTVQRALSLLQQRLARTASDGR
jgi:RNA polymerase sigma-70 factor (ECF subfamily)